MSNTKQLLIQAVTKQLTSQKPKELIESALGKSIDKYAAKIALVISTDPTGNLQNCSASSIVQAISEAATLGIEVDKRGYGYLVPRKGQATFQIGYKHYLKVLQNHKDVKSFGCEVVYQDDHFKEVKGSENPRIEHEPNYDSDVYGEFDSIKYVYAFCVKKDGSLYSRVMTKKQLDKLREITLKEVSDAAKKYSPWTNHPEEMYRKTVVKKLGKFVELEEIEDLISHDETEAEKYNEKETQEEENFIDLSQSNSLTDKKSDVKEEEQEEEDPIF